MCLLLLIALRPSLLRAAVFGDSIIGADGDGKGGLGRALPPFLQELGVEVVDVAGVGGSQAGHWLHTAGVLPLPGRGIARGAMRRSAVNQEAASLPRIAALDADLYWVNLATNDFHSGRTPQNFVANALDIISRLPEEALVIWSEGNDEPSHNAIKKKALALLRRKAPSRVLVLDTAGPRRAPYIGGGLHPSVARHNKWLEIVRPQIATFILAQGRPGQVAKVAAVLLGILVGAGLAWLATRRR